MKNVVAIMAFLIFTIGSSYGQDNPMNSQVDVKASTINWKGYKIGGSHTGTVNLNSGELTMNEEGALTGGNFDIDMTSLVCTDLEGNTADKLIGHLASDDFFSVESHPSAKLVITKVASRGVDGEYKVTADLTIKGNTNPVKFNVATVDGVMNAAITIDRSEYDVRYGSGSFFEKLGDNTIYDEFEISVSLVPIREK